MEAPPPCPRFLGAHTYIIAGIPPLRERWRRFAHLNIKNSNNKFIYADFERYISGLVGEELVRFDIYIKLKKSLIDLYFSEEMEYYHFFIEDEKRIFYKLLTLEEFWTISICELLRSTISQINQVPINITSGGRKFENYQYRGARKKGKRY